MQRLPPRWPCRPKPVTISWLSATTVFTTDYIFRGISNTDKDPAVQPEFDLTYGMFYAGIWGSNTDFGG